MVPLNPRAILGVINNTIPYPLHPLASQKENLKGFFMFTIASNSLFTAITYNNYYPKLYIPHHSEKVNKLPHSTAHFKNTVKRYLK